MWDAFKDLIFYGMEVVYNFVGDWGLAIIIATLVLRLVLFPLMQSQAKSSYKMQKLQPLMNEVQEKYADDPTKMQEEMQKIYRETKFNPLSGCLPLLLQMPIFIAVFQILRGDGADYDKYLGHYLEQGSCQFYNIVTDLTCSPSAALADGFMAFLPYLILLLIFALATFVPMMMNISKDSPQYTTTLIMGVAMTGMMLFIGWSCPAGVLLFWGVSSVFAVGQNFVTRHFMKKEDDEKEAERQLLHPDPVKVNVVRKEKKKRPTKKR